LGALPADTHHRRGVLDQPTIAVESAEVRLSASDSLRLCEVSKMKSKSGMDASKLVFSLLVAGMLLLPAAATAQTTGYMQIVGTQQGQIRGDSKDSEHQGWIEIISLSSLPGGSASSTMSPKSEQERKSATATTARPPIAETPADAKKTQTTQTAGQPGASGRASGSQSHSGEIRILKKVDKASPLLFKAATAGEPLKEVVIELRRSDGKSVQRLTLEKAMVSSIQRKTQAQGNVTEEELTLRYQQLTVQDF
jgi:type VI protein secretion system component Hcp